MGGQFKTYGPFSISYELGDVDEQQIADWFEQEVGKKHPGLPEAVGVYIICDKSAASKLIPWYVGKTYKGFLKRFRQHSQLKRCFGGSRKDWADKKAAIFLLALSSGKQEFRKPVTGKNKVLAIDAIEDMLIQDCLKLNSNLLNTSQKTLYRSLSVPGYVGPRKNGSDDSAKSLRQLFANV